MHFSPLFGIFFCAAQGCMDVKAYKEARMGSRHVWVCEFVGFYTKPQRINTRFCAVQISNLFKNQYYICKLPGVRDFSFIRSYWLMKRKAKFIFPIWGKFDSMKSWILSGPGAELLLHLSAILSSYRKRLCHFIIRVVIFCFNFINILTWIIFYPVEYWKYHDIIDIFDALKNKWT